MAKKKTLKAKSIEEPVGSDLREATVRFGRDGRAAELRIPYRLRDADAPDDTNAEVSKTLDHRVSTLDPADLAIVDAFSALALRLVKAEEGPFA